MQYACNISFTKISKLWSYLYSPLYSECVLYRYFYIFLLKSCFLFWLMTFDLSPFFHWPPTHTIWSREKSGVLCHIWPGLATFQGLLSLDKSDCWNWSRGMFMWGRNKITCMLDILMTTEIILKKTSIPDLETGETGETGDWWCSHYEWVVAR